MASEFDTIVVGAGIVGAACSEALAREGLRVLVLDAGTPGGGATAEGMGHLTVLDDSDAEFALTSRSMELWNSIAPSLPPRAEYQNCGTLWVAEDEEEMAIAEKKRAVLAAHGLEANLVSATELRVLEPELRTGLAGGLKVPGESVVFSPSVVRHFLDTVRAKGGALRTAIVSKIEEGRVQLADGSSLQSPCIVNAAGTAAALIQDFPEEVPKIRPRKGQLLITARYPGFCEHEIVELGYMKSAHSGAGSSVACNIQARPGGQVLIGSCRSFGDTSRDVDWGLLARMMQRARRFLPRLGDLQVLRTWVGFRAASDDKLPMIGKLPGSETLYLACGHEGLGMTTALATGELLAAEIRGAATKIDPQPYRPCRLSGSTGTES